MIGHFKFRADARCRVSFHIDILILGSCFLILINVACYVSDG